MATSNSSFNGFTGRNGNTIYYLRLGKPTSRTAVDKINAAPSLKQLIARQPTSVVNDFISSVKEFIYLGFQLEAKLAQKTSRDLINSYTRINAIKGEYPNKEIDFTKVLFSMGKMPQTPETKVKLNDYGLEFTWNTALITGKFRTDDQVVLLAYFPELKSAEYSLYATNRAKGTAQLSLLKNEIPTLMEIYLYFVSIDRKTISNSTYLGQLILPAVNSTTDN